jgi:hypothetical protein
VHADLVPQGLVPRWVLLVLYFVLVMRFQCRWGVIHLAVVEVCVAAPASPRHSVVLVAGWLWLGADLAVSALCLANASW